jgi:HSP20 family protein
MLPELSIPRKNVRSAAFDRTQITGPATSYSEACRLMAPAPQTRRETPVNLGAITMNALTRFERLDDMFPDMFRRMMRPLASAGFDAPGEIRVDVSEDDKGYEVRAEVPGAKKEDIRVTVDRNYVSISAEVKRESEDKSGEDKSGNEKRAGRTLVKELYHGSSSRSFTLAHEVDEKAAQAKYDNGVLVLKLPKKLEAGSRNVAIQ